MRAPVPDLEILRWLDAKNRMALAEWRSRRIRMSLGGAPDPRDEYARDAYRRILLRRGRLQGVRFQVLSTVR